MAPRGPVAGIWDERRLVVPFASFIQEPFENWTRRSADILGTVFLWADYRVPVDDARAALEAIVAALPQWDGRVCNVQVVDTTEHAVKLRALVSASDSGRAWDVRVRRPRTVAGLAPEEPPRGAPAYAAGVRAWRDPGDGLGRFLKTPSAETLRPQASMRRYLIR